MSKLEPDVKVQTVIFTTPNITKVKHFFFALIYIILFSKQKQRFAKKITVPKKYIFWVYFFLIYVIIIIEGGLAN